ncbi:hypothetical protein [Bradyrhizobium sp. SYSU BS000235]|uniref:hypothetical protein n=1 Tax=Bradyrhizobium sp. SYSU BS000235 TaxID=3411332 RepID=UPI003C78FA8B
MQKAVYEPSGRVIALATGDVAGLPVPNNFASFEPRRLAVLDEELVDGASIKLWFMQPEALTFVFLVLGTMRVAALIANGNWPIYGPFVRAIGALLGACMWLIMDLALFNAVANDGTPPSLGLPVYFFLFVFELISMYRALAGRRHGYRNSAR